MDRRKLIIVLYLSLGLNISRKLRAVVLFYIHVSCMTLQLHINPTAANAVSIIYYFFDA